MKKFLLALVAVLFAFSASAAEKRVYSPENTLYGIKNQLEYALSYGVGLSQSDKLRGIPGYSNLQCPVDISKIKPEEFGREWSLSMKIDCLQQNSKAVAYTVLVNIEVDSGYPTYIESTDSWNSPFNAEARSKNTIDGIKYRYLRDSGATYINIDAHLIDIAKTN